VAAGYQEIIRYIDEHVKEEITIAGLAGMAGYSANHIYKLFRVYAARPVMEYVRRKRLYAAASEMYTGRKLCDIALDYGYETPAGFYKAFKSVFGCSPSKYKTIIRKEGTAVLIDNIKTTEELERALGFFQALYPGHRAVNAGNGEKFGREWWERQLGREPGLLLQAKDGEKLCAATLGFSEDGRYVTVHEGALEEYRGTGIFEALFVELEKRARLRGYAGIALGIGEGEEEFYAALGYVGKTLIQSETYSVEELEAFNAQHGRYEAAGSGVYEGHVSQLWLNASLLDKTLKRKYEEEIGDCWVQVVVSKELR